MITDEVKEVTDERLRVGNEEVLGVLLDYVLVFIYEDLHQGVLKVLEVI